MMGFDKTTLTMLLLMAAVGCNAGTAQDSGDGATGTVGFDTTGGGTKGDSGGSVDGTGADCSLADVSVCDDDNPCTADDCLDGTCAHEPAADGTPCTAPDNMAGSCQAGVCEGGGPPQVGECPGHVAVSIDEAEIDCSDSRFFCVDSTQAGGDYYATIQSAIDAVGDAAAGKVVVVYGSQDATPLEYDGFAIIGDGAGSPGQASHGGSGNSANERFIVKAVGNVLLRRRSPASTEAPILVQDTDFVTIDGFNIDREEIGQDTSSYSESGMRVSDSDWAMTRPSYGIHVVNVSIRRGSPADLYSANVADVVIESSRLIESLPSDGYGNGGMLLYIANGPSDNTVVRCNYFADSNQMAIHSNGDDDLQENHLYEYNVFKDVGDHGIHFQDGRDMVIRNNAFINMSRSAVTAWGINYPPEGFEIYNNLFYNSAGSSPSAVQMGTDSYSADNGYHTVFNNLFIGNVEGNDMTIHSMGTNVVANNFDELAQSVDTTQVSTVAVPTSIFMDYDNDDYRLASTAQQDSLSALGVASIMGAQGEPIVVPALDMLSNTRGMRAITVGPYEY